MKTTMQAAAVAVLGMALAGPAGGHSPDTPASLPEEFWSFHGAYSGDIRLRVERDSSSADAHDVIVTITGLEYVQEIGYERGIRHYRRTGRIAVAGISSPAGVDYAVGRVVFGTIAGGRFVPREPSIAFSDLPDSGVAEDYVSGPRYTVRRVTHRWPARLPLAGTNYIAVAYGKRTWGGGSGGQYFYAHAHHRTPSAPPPPPAWSIQAVVPSIRAPEGSPAKVRVVNTGATRVQYRVSAGGEVVAAGQGDVAAGESVGVDLDQDAGFPAGWQAVRVEATGPVYVTAIMRMEGERKFVPVTVPLPTCPAPDE